MAGAPIYNQLFAFRQQKNPDWPGGLAPGSVYGRGQEYLTLTGLEDWLLDRPV